MSCALNWISTFLLQIQCSLLIPPPFGPEKFLAISEGGGTTRGHSYAWTRKRPETFLAVSDGGGTTKEHSYAWTRELAMNLLNGEDDGYKGVLNLCTYVNVLFDNTVKLVYSDH